jgi:Glucodextranase, domain B
MRVAVVGAVVGFASVAVTGCGSTTTTTTNVASESGSVVVAVTSPTSGTVIAADSVTVRGTVSPPNAIVQVQGKPAAVGNGVFTGTATLHGGKTRIDVIGSAPNQDPGSTSVSVTRQSGGSTQKPKSHTTTVVPPSSTPAPSQPSTSGRSSCGGDLSVGPNTSCAFAANVRATYQRFGGGAIDVFSPTTGKTYVMSCANTGSEVTCTGANNASVYFP